LEHEGDNMVVCLGICKICDHEVYADGEFLQVGRRLYHLECLRDPDYYKEEEEKE